MPIELEVNGSRHRLEVDPGRSLLDVLREDLGLTGTKYGCGEGQCAACTVLLDGQAVHSCTLPVSGARWRKVTTIEGLERDGELHPVQKAFLEEQALQCGYCTPGMIMGAVSLLATNPDPSEAEVVDGMNGHLCRCGTYPRVVKAIRRAAAQSRGTA
jgi:aerobic-type carbon monoxide dehydrogenase small subunit (CoxS/CutS family)